jgi:YD repeat-containing protein
MEDVVIAGGEQVIRVSVADDVLTVTAAPWWQQRLTRDEARRLAEAIERVAG